MTPKNVRTFADLQNTLNKRASAIKVASQQKTAAGEDVVPEKDPQDKGTTSIPKDPDGKDTKTVGLENKTNAEVTSSFTTPPAKTVTGEEKPASDLAKKAQSIAVGLKNLSATLKKKAGEGTVGSDGKSVTPLMPPNTQVNTGTTEGGTNKPPSGGAGSKNNPDPNAKTATAEAAEPGKMVSLPKGDSKGEIPASKTNANETKKDGQPAMESKAAASPKADASAPAECCPQCKGKMPCDCSKKSATGGDDFVVDPSYHFKLASLILADEEGRSVAQHLIEKDHGAQAASDIIKAATIMESRAIELAQAEEEGARQAEKMFKNASESDRGKIIKLARVHSTTREGYGTDLEKWAYDAGAMTAAQMGDAGMLGGAGAGVGPEAGADPAALAGAASPEMGAGMPPGMPPGMPGAEAGAMPPGAEAGAGGGGEGLTEEAVVAALDEMVSSGEITPEIAAEILQALTGGGGAPGGEAGAGGPPPGMEGGMPPEVSGMPAGGEGAPREASESPAKEKKEESEESEEEKESRVIKQAHTLAVAAVASLKKAA